jgi:hypothetical protein
MKKIIFLLLAVCCFKVVFAQELFVFTEPASNMATKSVGLRLMNLLGTKTNESKTNYHLMPEIMVGVNNKVMFHLQGFLSDVNGKFVGEGASVYTKYRFLSNDEVHQHFRMAAYARASYNNALVHQDEIETMGHNSGFEGGLIATQLLHKVAISSSVSFENAIFNNAEYTHQAINYTLSVGKLMFPKEYTNYEQTNINLMLELLGQKLVGSSKNYIDIAPSIQFIINSVARIDVGLKTQLVGNMQRTSTTTYILKLEYNLFNVWK